MNATARAANRVLLAVTGLVLVAAGALVIALAIVPVVADRWRAVSRQLVDSPQTWVGAPVVGGASPLVLGVAVAALALTIALLRLLARQGGGRTAAALDRYDEAGRTRLDVAVPKGLLLEHLGARGELDGVRIAAYEVRGTPMLRISARCRRGVAPDVVATSIGRAMRDLETIVGTDVPALVLLSGGYRLRGAAAARTD